MENTSPHFTFWKSAMTVYFQNRVKSNNISDGTKLAMLSSGFSENDLLQMAVDTTRDLSEPVDVSVLDVVSGQNDFEESVVSCTHPVLT